MSLQPMWSCPKCGREFANRNQTHSCGNYTLEQIFDDKSPEIRAIFDAFVLVGDQRHLANALDE